MQIKNNYELRWRNQEDFTDGEGVFNGDVGFIESINKDAGTLMVIFDEDRYVTYDFSQLDELELAYAVTVHKSQGSEFEAVILPVIDVPPMLCYRNLFYTAVTRARSKMITIGRQTTIEDMVNNDRKIRRYSALRTFLEAGDGLD